MLSSIKALLLIQKHPSIAVEHAFGVILMVVTAGSQW